MSKTPADAMMEQLEWKPCVGEVIVAGDYPIATHEAILNIGGHELRCYQLSNGQRLIHADDVHDFFSGFGIDRPKNG